MLNCYLVYTSVTVDWQNDGMKNNKSMCGYLCPEGSGNISTKTRTIHTAVMKDKCPAVAYTRTQERNTCTKLAHET